MAEYHGIWWNMAEYHGIWRNITEYGGISRNMAEYHDIFPEYLIIIIIIFIQDTHVMHRSVFQWGPAL
jgi:hypothetical protein